MAIVTCTKEFNLHIEPSTCPDWTSMTWAAAVNYDKLGGANVASNFGGNQYSTFWNNFTLLNDYGVYGGAGTLNYIGGACNCQARVVLVKNFESANAGFEVLQDGLPRLVVNASGYATGTHLINFSILATVGSVITVRGTRGVNHFYTFGTGLAGPTSWGVQLYNI